MGADGFPSSGWRGEALHIFPDLLVPLVSVLNDSPHLVFLAGMAIFLLCHRASFFFFISTYSLYFKLCYTVRVMSK